MSLAAETVIEALELLPEEMREPAAAWLLFQARQFRALKDAVDEGLADVEAGRLVPWDLADFLHRARLALKALIERERAQRLVPPGSTAPEAKHLRRPPG
jgi:hypothetical protein